MKPYPETDGSALSKVIQRRTFLLSAMVGASVGATALSLPRGLVAQTRSGQITTQPLRDGLSLIRGAGANVLVMQTPEGIVMVDGGAPEFSAALLEVAFDLSELKRVETLFNTNWRPEHTGVNEMLGAAGTQIIAHENTRLWMGNDFTVAWENRRYSPRPAQALPNHTFYKEGRIRVGLETIDYGLLPRAHTDGDIYVFFRRANVLVVSDLLAVESWPILDYSTGGWIGGYLKACESLLELADDDTVIVPALGLPQNRSAVERQRNMCEAMLEAVGQAYTGALSLDEFIETKPAQAWSTELGNPDLFLHMAYKGAWGHIRDMGVSIV